MSGELGEAFEYRTPVQAGAPWPLFRRDHRNTGNSPIVAQYHGDSPWHVQTGKGIFSTPIIDREGSVYFGSADHRFYALNPDGSLQWSYVTGEIIDSAGALLDTGDGRDCDSVVFPSGDGFLYCLCTSTGEPRWTFDARTSPRASSYNNWFEGNVAVGFDGCLYAGNTNFNYYAINPDGSLRWTYKSGSNCWSCAALAEDGTVYWGSLDTRVRAVGPNGLERWSRRTLGFVAASAAVGLDGTVYIGSFDSYLYALDPRAGRTRWRFKTGDHIYASVALGESERGDTEVIYLASTDGKVYALQACDGSLLWTYDTGAPIRSSPAVGRAPEGESGDIVYVGSGNGRLYALHGVDGRRRWSFDTTAQDPELADRNDLNGSPALGLCGIYIGGEHGQLWYVPYDYPLYAPQDPRGSVVAPDDMPSTAVFLAYTSPGGNLKFGEQPVLSTASVLTLRLVARKDGETREARVYNAPIGRPKDALSVSIEPSIPIHVEHSSDGRYIHIFPKRFLEPDTLYTVHVEGNYYDGGLGIGNLTLGGRKRGRFADTVRFRTRSPEGPMPLLSAAKDQVPAFEWTRLSVPIPTMLPSLNQIGFDYMDWIVGVVDMESAAAGEQKRMVLWAIGGHRNRDGVLVADPDSGFMLPLSGSYRDDAFMVSNQHFTMEVTGIPIPFRHFEIRGQMRPDLRVHPGATAHANTEVLSIPTFGLYLAIGGLANNWWQKLLPMGTYVTRPYAGPANHRPDEVSVVFVECQAPRGSKDGRIVAEFSVSPDSACELGQHRLAVLLLDQEKMQAVPIDYHHCTEWLIDGQGGKARVELRIPRGTSLPGLLSAVALFDVFPVHRERLGA